MNDIPFISICATCTPIHHIQLIFIFPELDEEAAAIIRRKPETPARAEGEGGSTTGKLT